MVIFGFYYLTCSGNITGGLPAVQAPPFYIEYGNQTYNFAEICTNLGSALFVTPLIAILESVAIAKSFGNTNLVPTRYANFDNF